MGDFDWKIWFKKWGFGLLATVGAYGTLYTATFIGQNPFPPEYAFWSGLIVITLTQIGNWVKHTFLAEE
jgi:hypothetical protein